MKKLGASLVWMPAVGILAGSWGSALAAEAVDIGLANKMVPAQNVMLEARNIAAKIAARSPLVLKLLKRTLLNGADMPLSAALPYEQSMIGLVFDTSDAHEGCSAFLEKRKASFAGR